MTIDRKEIIKKQKKTNIFLSLMLFLFVFVGSIVSISLVTVAHASTKGSLSVSGLTTSEKGDTSNSTWTLSGTGATGEVTGTAATSGCNSQPAKSKTSTLTFKNSKSVTASFSFSYTPTVNGGSVKVNGSSVSSAGTLGPMDLAANGTVDVVITSAAGAKKTSITISNISLVADVTVTGHFMPVGSAGGGTYKVDGTTVGSSTIDITKSSTEAFSLVATPSSGYTLFGWRVSTSASSIDSGTVVSQATTYNYLTDVSSFYVKPVFMKSGTAIFKVNNVLYYDFDAAISASSSTYPCILNANGTLYSNNSTYTIPSGKTLLIPKDANEKVVTTSPSTIESSSNPSAFRTLTIDNDVHIVVNGNICLAGDQYRSNGRTAGPCGMIKFKDGTNSTITLKSGSILYAWGYIWGNSGSIIAENGSKIYEAFNLAGWRGGSATSSMLDNSYKVFAVNQFYVQNIEVQLDVYAGSQVYVRTAVHVTLAGTLPATVNFMGADGMFKVTEGYVSRKYAPEVDTFNVTVYGKVTVSPMKISISGYSMNSGSFILPIPSAFAIYVASTGTITTNQDLEFLPGSKMVIDDGGKLNITNSKSVFFIDLDEWGNYAYENGNKLFSTVWYTPNSAKRKAKTSSNIVDAELDLNGTVTVASGAGLYTTVSGANIHSSNMSGDITFANGPGSQKTIYFAVQSSNTISSYDAKSVTNAKLRNGASYIEAGGEEFYLTDNVEPGYNITYNYVEDKWGPLPAQPEEYTVTFHDPVSGNSTTKVRIQNETIDLLTWAEASAAGFANNGYRIKGWTIDGKLYDVGQLDVNDLIDDDVTFEAYWGGWYTFNSECKYVIYDSSASISYASGIYQIAAGDSRDFALEGGISISGGDQCYFSEVDNSFVTHIGDGVLTTVYTEWMQLFEGNYYYLSKGVVQKGAGLIYLESSSAYHYIDENGIGYSNSIHYLDIEPNAYGLENGYYYFDEYAKIDLENLPEPVIIDGSLYISDGEHDPVIPEVYHHGLLAVYDSSTNYTYLYFIKIDGTVVRGNYHYGNNFTGVTFYVTSEMAHNYKIDGVDISEGLYYFDSNGHMYDDSLVEIKVSGHLAGKNFVMNGGNS